MRYVTDDEGNKMSVIISLTEYDEYRKLKLNNDKQVVFDIKSILDKADGRL